MTFRVGQKVVSLITFTMVYGRETGPIKNGIYTVREVECRNGDIVIRLAEIINEKYSFRGEMVEAAWLASRFRPVVERITDISIFTAMLNTSKRGVEA